MSYVDLHCHLLPGLDDGAATADDMLKHARRLHAEGVRDVACTPHVKRDEFPGVPIRELSDRMAAAQRAIRAAGLGVRLHLGAELAHTDALLLPESDLERIAQGPEGSRWLLLECPFDGIDDNFALAFRRLQGLGYGLLLAHPERSAGLLGGDGLGRLRPLLAQGALLQVNVCSLLGNHGLDAQDAAVRLVREGLAYCLASDGHPGSREQTLQLGFHLLLRAGASSTQAYRLTQANPRLLLRDGVRRPLVDLERALAAAA
ncbi:CpsB/CapC family capsule biosynthesis tyrosine phosphatase [Conexibacter stalactiti]|uniref:protein-tyrosine-phosphatase n=1 Tax=Conexibacter stalactiti TaxID=1940611 RepID=A0ABU4I106_9ACTN|nr:CpsB/CapC family capsule biosynthesis tyrosine phosphatase [Conexibacter stalactiti]MDW5597994.1 CpsB/CapC family capsule biosynthesis tyrosine phosphatase [Conexibacter stalactiti]MEC5038636.1 CpsB/CapC family capsule biosynthesis tyrosine phosphatase [Conexibacter stalactiti]